MYPVSVILVHPPLWLEIHPNHDLVLETVSIFRPLESFKIFYWIYIENLRTATSLVFYMEYFEESFCRGT